jgi:hypothetical protein
MLLKNLCPVQEEPERSDDLSDDIPKPEQTVAPTAITMTARIVFHYAVRSLKDFGVSYPLQFTMSRQKSHSCQGKIEMSYP